MPKVSIYSAKQVPIRAFNHCFFVTSSTVGKRNISQLSLPSDQIIDIEEITL